MNNQYEYIGKTLTPSIAEKLILELFTGKTSQKQEIIKKVDQTHLERGGKPSIARFHHPVTLALSSMRQYGLAENPEYGSWSIPEKHQEGEVAVTESSETLGLSRITTLNEFMEWTQQLAPEEYLFRGVQNEDYKIEASAYRRPKKGDRDFEKFLQINKELIKDARLRGLDVKDGRELRDLEILAEFQHFRAATCLIDFTYSAQVALWFACGQDSENPSNGKVFAIRNKPPKFKEITPDLLQEKIDYFLKNNAENSSQHQLQSKQLYQWQPRQLNNRIGAQQSIFLFGDSEIDPDEECIIVEESKQDMRTALQQGANITEAILFPDFDGFARLRTHNTPYTQLSASEYRERADLAYQRQEFAEAITDYDEAIHLDPDDAQTYYQRGLAKASQGQYELAVTDYDEAINRLPEDNAEFHQTRGNANYTLKRYSAAINDYNEAIRIFPNDINSYYRRGRTNAELNQHAAAITDYDEAIRLLPNHTEFHRWRGFSKYELKQYQHAINDYNEAIRINSGDGKAHYLRGLASFELKQYEAAISDFDKAVSLKHIIGENPHPAYIYYWRACAKKELGRLEEAITDCQTAFPLAMQVADDDPQLAHKINDLCREIDSRVGDPK